MSYLGGTLTTALDSLLGGGLASLDLTRREHDLVVSRYRSLGKVLDEHWTPTHGDNVITVQGSFLLGTVVRNIHRNDDVDIDAVAVRDIDRQSITQAELKDDVGSAAAKYARHPDSDGPTLREWERCWTLSWSGMHLDVLPALPAPDGRGSLLITDRRVRTWLMSNPSGYAAWFRSLMQNEVRGKMEIEAKRTEIEQVPEHLVKTTLQQTVQALKRHRDIYFESRLDQRPSSIVITTLAGLAYQGEGDLYDVLRQITSTMSEHLQRKGGMWLLPNPSQTQENFVDSWGANPSAPANLFEWLDAAGQDISALGARRGIHNTLPLLESAFGTKVAERASESFATSLDSARTRGHLAVTPGGLLSTTGVRPGTTDQKAKEHGFAGGRSF